MDVTSYRKLQRHQDARMSLPLSKPHFQFLPKADVRESRPNCRTRSTYNVNNNGLHHQPTVHRTAAESADVVISHGHSSRNRPRLFPRVNPSSKLSQSVGQYSSLGQWTSTLPTKGCCRVSSAPRLGYSSTDRRTFKHRRPASVDGTLDIDGDREAKGCSGLANDSRMIGDTRNAWTVEERERNSHPSELSESEARQDLLSQKLTIGYRESAQFVDITDSGKAEEHERHLEVGKFVNRGKTSESVLTTTCSPLYRKLHDEDSVDTGEEGCTTDRTYLDPVSTEPDTLLFPKLQFNGTEDICNRAKGQCVGVKNETESCFNLKEKVMAGETLEFQSVNELKLIVAERVMQTKGVSQTKSNISTNQTKKSSDKKCVVRAGNCDKQVLKHLKESMNRSKKRKQSQEDYGKVVREHVPGAEELASQQETETRRAIFRKTASFVRYAVRIMTCMEHLSSTMAPRSATEEQWHAVNTSDQARDMAFNKASFAKKKDRLKVPTWARYILEKSPSDREEKELRRLHALLRGLKSFDKFTEKIQISMCRSFTYHSVKSGRIILRQGHVGINFYFLYTGSVFVNTDDTDVHGNQFTKTEVVLCRGDSFGELALLQDIRRTASVSAREDCELLVVDKDTFSHVCPRIFEKELEEKINFLRRVPLFTSRVWERASLKKLCFEAQILEYKTNKIVVEDNAKEDWIYVCMEGQCDVIQKFNLLEELEWRMFAQAEINRRQSVTQTGSDVIGLLELLGVRKKSVDLSGDVLKELSSINVAEGKQRLLDSMGLEYRKIKKRRDSRPDVQTTDTRIETVSVVTDNSCTPLTVTSLLSRDEDDPGVKNLYLRIKILQPLEIFDMCHLMGRQITRGTGGYILVSAGARLLRVKRGSFLRNASQAGIQLAKTLSSRERYPSDEILLQCYKDCLSWDVYKQSVLMDTVGHRTRQDNESGRHKQWLNTRKHTLNKLNQVVGDYDLYNKELSTWEKMALLSTKKHPSVNVSTRNCSAMLNERSSIIAKLNPSTSKDSCIRFHTLENYSSTCSDYSRQIESGDSSKSARLPLYRTKPPQRNHVYNRQYDTISEQDEVSSPRADV